MHDPERAAARGEMREKGVAVRRENKGKRNSPSNVPDAPKNLEDAARIASWLTKATYIGDIDARTSEATTKALRNFQLIVEKRDLLRQIEQLRAALKEAKQSQAAAVR